MAKNRKKKNETLYGIIGLGRFGMALAQSLAAAGREILVVDREQSKINQAAAFTDNAYRVDELTRENLEAVGLQECDVVVIGIGERIDTSILAALTVLRLGVKRVIAKAMSEDQGEVLTTLGAEVVYPEKDMAMRLANKLMAPNVLEYISLSGDIDIMEIALTEKVSGKSVLELNLRQQFGLNIIAVEQNSRLTADVRPDMILQEGDTIAVIGRPEQIRYFENYLQG
ncbi:MAG: TrkA family potassium uptake protein [Clostridia bacterium]|nr:TrkA family potassium uptake protein [Clostridia bacterium]